MPKKAEKVAESSGPSEHFLLCVRVHNLVRDLRLGKGGTQRKEIALRGLELLDEVKLSAGIMLTRDKEGAKTLKKYEEFLGQIANGMTE